MNHTVGIEYRKKLNGDGKHRSTVNCLARGWKVSISRGECRWALVNVSPSDHKGNGVSAFLVFEGTGGIWDRQQRAVCGVSGTEYGCFETVCLETAYHAQILDVIFWFVGWHYTATNRAVTQETGGAGQGYIFLLQYNHSQQNADNFLLS